MDGLKVVAAVVDVREAVDPEATAVVMAVLRALEGGKGAALNAAFEAGC